MKYCTQYDKIIIHLEVKKIEKKETRQNVWNKKNGWVSKSYHLKKNVVTEFAEACEIAGVSQAGQLTKMMKDFIKSVKDVQNDN